ncbi:MAG TPA: cytochrome c [Verrucomicrobiae bacterium]|nr:cytochrome c [Verrucomicrobiae bacterium]
MKHRFLLGLIVGIILAVLVMVGGTYAYFAGGHAPVATDSKPMPFEKWLARTALHARMEKEIPTTVPIEATEPNLRAGAELYVEHCAVCHGLPEKSKTAIAAGMFPRPPQLFHGKGVTDDPPGETYWKVANGIRLSGMPGFRSTLKDDQLWQVSLLLAKADQLPKSVESVLTAKVLPAGK